MTTIVVADDEREIRFMVRRCLEREGWQVLEAEDGSEALRLCRSGQVDALVTDLIMPGQEGVETIMAVRSEYPDMRIVAISGGGRVSGARDFLPTAKLLGADHVLAKPFDPATLVQILRTLLPK